MDEDNHGEAVFLSPTLVFSPSQSARKGGGHEEDARMREDMRLSCLDIPSLPRSAAVYPHNTYPLIKERFSDIGQPCNNLHALIHRR